MPLTERVQSSFYTLNVFPAFYKTKAANIMKRTKFTLFLSAFVIMLTALSAVAPNFKSKQIPAQISYYWFDPSHNYLFRQNTVTQEIAITGYDESTQNPKTLQEKGYSSGSVSFDQNGLPYPITSVPDKALYSHP
jgi:hypothetical protein